MGRRPYTKKQKNLRGKITLEGRLTNFKEIKRAAIVVNGGKTGNVSSFMIKAGLKESRRVLGENKESGFSCKCETCPFCEEMKTEGEILKKEEKEEEKLW